MRLYALIACGAVAACTSGPVSAPRDAVLYEVPPQSMQTSRRDDFTRRIESALGEGDAQAAAADTPRQAAADVPRDAAGTPLDADFLNLTLYTIEQQKIDAAIAERELEAARRQLVIVQPGPVPQQVEGVNIALFAKETTHRVGDRRYARSLGAFATSRANCRRFSSPDQAQRVFLSSGGPQRDPYNLDPDGDGFACEWDPTPYRRLAQ